MGDLEGKRILVTGGAGDIGSAMGIELLRQGACVTLLDLKSEAEAEPWLALVRSHGVADYVRADVRDRQAVEAALGSLDRVDVAIGNAGIVESAPFLHITPEQWQKHLDVNLTGCFHLTQVAARLMVERGVRGLILLTGSWVQERPWPEIAAYSASKAALRMLARSAAAELASHGIRVNVLAPGIVRAGLARHQMETEPQYARRAARAIPLGEPQTAEQVARAAAFLCSDAADYMTGAVLLVDGGCSLGIFD
jgi:NAD(P)-dependent dehydrogenase (short-subunit alcohol dehydrogenase family)